MEPATAALRDDAVPTIGMASPTGTTRRSSWRLSAEAMQTRLSPRRTLTDAVSPVLRTVFGADQVAALSTEYARLAKES